MVEYRRAFADIRKDPHWKRKLALGVLIALIPYLGTVWMIGWEMQYQRNVAWGEEARIPEWSDFTGQALLGLKALLAVLPYSLLLSAVTTPPLMAGMILFSLGAESDPVSAGITLAIGVAIWFLMLMGLTIALMPLTGSVTLRVSLFGTIESGFELKETWRLMREAKTDLLKAWGFSALNIGITFAALLALTALIGAAGLLAFASGSLTALIALVVAAPPISFLVVMALALFLGLANAHYFGRYGRVAYRLDKVGERA